MQAALLFPIIQVAHSSSNQEHKSHLEHQKYWVSEKNNKRENEQIICYDIWW